MDNFFGFTLLRNGVKYDYCFREALISLNGITSKTILALGESDDGTEEAVSDLEFLQIVPTVWDDSLREGGLILSQQTNVALEEAKKRYGELENSWGVYLQCDEVFHEDDYELIKEDLRKAGEEGYDTVAFRYFHFWMTHDQVAINKKWYPQEIRAVRLNGNIESWGDAQTFRNHNRTYYSEGRIFHYGHVREEDSYKSKKADILKLYHKDEKLSKYKRREKRFDNQTEMLSFYGKHPAIMRKRLERLGGEWFPEKVEEVFLLGDPNSFPATLTNKIHANKVTWVKTWFEIPSEKRDRFGIDLNTTFFTRLLGRSYVPTQMRSKLALPWTNETILLFKVSEKGIGFNF